MIVPFNTESYVNNNFEESFGFYSWGLAASEEVPVGVEADVVREYSYQ